jgi:hypothetical protein
VSRREKNGSTVVSSTVTALRGRISIQCLSGEASSVLGQYPGLGMEFTLNDRVATYFPAQPAGNR